ncbi:MAG: Rieske 2Fe-2S domain-containing protein [Anaerolineae bacterium]|nr:Rieske 2Fe-2S domain-containing protein [Anaerolineae bacterium]MCA9887678.1 Rieske 2Fe-2S domain-containing protein [Anaerolineae bacterium]MCA9892386.1 Rieske 2Fe-2S domain-containing protein [Anaerolineae bacterium]MCB9458975.1 Rieske 2Fe-2S domain-containing protein [Anaerolineaceae bacterium]
MATTSQAVERASVARPSTATTEPAVRMDAPTRREFMYYIWGASIALLLGQATAGLIWFVFPRFREGEFGGIFPFDPADLPPVNAAPDWVAGGRFHVSNTDDGLLALYGVCTHLGCLPKWVASNVRFECPCHGSKFTRNGTYIEGPAPRGLDRFRTTIVFTDGTSAETDETGGPIPIPDGKTIAEIRVNTGSKILGPGH